MIVLNVVRLGKFVNNNNYKHRKHFCIRKGHQHKKKIVITISHSLIQVFTFVWPTDTFFSKSLCISHFKDNNKNSNISHLCCIFLLTVTAWKLLRRYLHGRLAHGRILSFSAVIKYHVNMGALSLMAMISVMKQDIRECAKNQLQP